MKTTCMMIEANGNMRHLDESDALAEWRAGQGPFWIDLDGGTADEMMAWTSRLGLNSNLIDLLQEGGHDAKILPLEEAVYFEYPVVAEDGSPDPTLFGCLCLDRLVVTMHERPVSASRWVEATIPQVRLRDASTTGIVCAVVVIQSMRLRLQAAELRNRARKMADSMDGDPESESLADILDLKHSVLVLDGVVSDQLAVMDTLQAIEKPMLHLAGLPEAFQIAVSNTRATDRSIDRLDVSTRDLQQRFESAQQDKTNRRLAILTIMTAIFSPLTLIAGIYGMNFEYMPELGYHNAYFIVLGAMAAIAGGLYWLLRSRGWLK